MASRRIPIFVLVVFLALTASAWGESLALPTLVSPLITTPLDPSFYVIPPGGPLVATGMPSAGIASLTISMASGRYGCSGSLLFTGQDILTAAHCISEGGPGPTVNSLTASFMGGAVTAQGVSYHTAPGWTGNFLDGSDIAIVHLDAPVPIAGYNIDATGIAGGGDVAGYGRYGLGSTGYTGGIGTLRSGANDLGDVYGTGFMTWDIPGNPYAYDFDSGLPENDALCIIVYGYSPCGDGSLGYGDLEVMIAPGDSGGPSFIGGLLAGVHSFGATFGMGGGDIDDVLNASVGELGGDTRVAAYADWIYSTVQPVPEPASMLLLGSGLSLLGLRRRKK